MPNIVIAKADKECKVLTVYDTETGITTMTKRLHLNTQDCLNYKMIRGHIEYIQGKSESRIPLYSDIQTGNFCYVLYKLKSEQNKNLGYRILIIKCGTIEIADYFIRDAVELFNYYRCINAKVVKEDGKVFISALKDKFPTKIIEQKARINKYDKKESVNRSENNSTDDLYHIMYNTYKKYNDTYNKLEKSGDEELHKIGEELTKGQEENQKKLEFIAKRIKKKSPLYKKLRQAMIVTLAVAMIGGVSFTTYNMAKPMFNRQEVTMEIGKPTSIYAKIPVDTESSRVRLLNAKEAVVQFNGDDGVIYVDGVEAALIHSVFNRGIEDVKITDLDGNILQYSKENIGYGKNAIYKVVKDKESVQYKLDSNLTGLVKSLNIENTQGEKIGSVKSSKYLNGLRYRIVNSNGNELYRFNGSKLTDKSFQIKKENISSDISMIDALILAATYNTHIDDTRYE